MQIPEFQLPKPDTQYSIAGKTFILGEYGILMGLPALVASIGPRFRLSIVPVGQSSKFQEFHPRSPIALLRNFLRERGAPDFHVIFEDPHGGSGGFGASTAQFAMVYAAAFGVRQNEGRSWEQPWKLYRHLLRDEPLLPSGADLIGQWEGGITLFDPSTETVSCVLNSGGSGQLDGSKLLVFSATRQKNRKTPTHEHLELLARAGFLSKNASLKSALRVILDSSIQAVNQNDLESLGKGMDAFADVLRSFHLEDEGAYRDRQFLRRLSGVAGVKGAGAMQSDVILVLLKSQSTPEDRKQVIESALQLGLSLVSDGVDNQSGIHLNSC